MSKWTDTNLIPLSGLEYWHALDDCFSGASVSDFSGNGRHLEAAATAPTLQLNQINGQPAVYFDGTKQPLRFTGESVLLKHIFIIAAFDGASFTGYEGLLSDTGTIPVLFGNGAAAVKFYDLDYGGIYRKNNLQYLESNQLAPVSSNFALIELIFASGLPMNGFQIGQDRSFTDRKWKGWFVEDFAFSRVLTETERRRTFLYCAIKFGLQKKGIPFYFPSDDLLEDQPRSRFYAAPLDYSKITEDYQFEDGNKTFNEKSDSPPRRWEYNYLGNTPEESVVFDEFYNQARTANAFLFRDKYGIVWQNVRVEDYDRTHDAHKSWIIDCKFKLVKYANGATDDISAPLIRIAALQTTGTITLTAEVLDENSVESVQYYLGGVLVGSPLYDAPYSLVLDSLDYEAGIYEFTAIAIDEAGNFGLSNTVTIEIVDYYLVDDDGLYLVDDDGFYLTDR